MSAIANMEDEQLELCAADVASSAPVPPPATFAGRDPSLEAERLREANPAGWAMLTGWALADARRGRRCSISFFCELLRRPEHHTAPVAGCPYLVNNTARAGLVRLLIAEYPELADAFETRSSRADV